MFQPFGRQETVRLTMGQALIKFLQRQYTEYDGELQRFIPAIWGIFGHGNVSGLSQALWEYGDQLPYYQPANEQSMVHAAAAFARTRLRAQTFACTTSIGPGATNMITGAAAAHVNRLPVLLLPSDYYATRFQGQVLQDIEHPVSLDMSVTDCFRVVSQFFDRITRPEQILYAAPEAMRVMTDPVDAGPATIALPQDIQSVAFDCPANFFRKKIWRIERRQPDERRIGEAIALLKEAKSPYILAGGGVHYAKAWAELREFSDAFGIPVGETHSGRGALKEESPLLIGGSGHTGTPLSGKYAADADLVFLVGTRLADFATGSYSAWQRPDVKFVSVNVSGAHAHKLGALPIVADARESLRALIAAGRAAGVKPNPGYVESLAVDRQNWLQQKRDSVYVQYPGERMSQAQVIGALNDFMDAEDTLVCAAGTAPGDLHQLFEATAGRILHLEFGYSCMGYDIPGAIGVRLARPDDGEVYVFLGDGNYLLHPMELKTAVQEGVKLTVILLQNDGFQSIHGHQKVLVGHSLGNEFRQRDLETGKLDDGEFLEIDYAKNAESFGLRAWNVADEAQLKTALEEARLEERSCMIVAQIERYSRLPRSGIWWDVFGAEVTNDDATKALVAEREEGRESQRFYW
ncbi:MAG: 3D-(3,5/4)-trihydroxycyclohexane-1,2-dione acylhydrolase (decyclizing) [Chloroflexota bacterium]|nr:3D-(3,5/4)-trihydroxycyclohexane-1,2-dione acylhydrolase (decyclizing) [Chloroflexota bacterium]MDE2945927.1 3D-(3,5/4)-trihydroxycyclohexane-1,2-dione acylhydrolase (decyclizing) [Chloroflexota bacterium]